AAAVGHVGVDGEVGPARGERLPVGQWTCGGEEGLHRRRGHEREASTRDRGLERRLDRGDPGFAHGPILRASAADPATQAADGKSGGDPRGWCRLKGRSARIESELRCRASRSDSKRYASAASRPTLGGVSKCRRGGAPVGTPLRHTVFYLLCNLVTADPDAL